jgi:translocator protein
MMAWFRFRRCSSFGLVALLLLSLDSTKAFSSSAAQVTTTTTRPSINRVERTLAQEDAAKQRRLHRIRNRIDDNTALKAMSQETSRTGDEVQENELDKSAIAKYAAAIAIQLSLIGGVFYGLDRLVDHFSFAVPMVVNIPLFYIMALKSRVFNPLSNARPAPQTLEAETAVPQKRNMPSWTPPGVIFPIMWLLIIGPIRAVSSSLIYASTGHYLCLPLLAFILHLSVGDVWNTINNVERRYGTAVTGVVLVWLSNLHAAYQYWQVDPTAGQLLTAVNVWLTIAATLVAATWRINPDPITGQIEPLYPVKGSKAETKFIWFSGGQS